MKLVPIQIQVIPNARIINPATKSGLDGVAVSLDVFDIDITITFSHNESPELEPSPKLVVVLYLFLFHLVSNNMAKVIAAV